MTRILPCLAALLALAPACDPRPQEVTVGVALGESTFPAIQLAADTVNERGGVRGVPLRVVGLDWKDPGFLEPSATIEWAELLATRRDVMGVIGHNDSSATLAAASLYNHRELPHVVTIATHPDITRIGPWTYRLCLDDHAQGAALARHAVDTWSKRRIAMFYVNDDYGRGLAESFQSEVAARGGKIVDGLFHRDTPDESDEALIEQMVAGWSNHAPDLVVLLNRPPAARRILTLAREAGHTVPVLGGDNVSLMLGYPQDHALLEGARMASFFVADRERPEVARVLEVYRSLTGLEANYDATLAYDAVMLMALAIERGGFSRKGVRGALESIATEGLLVEGVAGAYTLGEDRNAHRALHIVELEGGRPRVVESCFPDPPAAVQERRDRYAGLSESG